MADVTSMSPRTFVPPADLPGEASGRRPVFLHWRRTALAAAVLLAFTLWQAEGMWVLAAGMGGWVVLHALLESRHRGILRFAWGIDPATRAVVLPRLLLQPLVENAVNHGALRRREGGEVRVRTAVTGEGRAAGATLLCEVEDNGPGVGPGPVRDGALGLALVRRRIEAMHPEARFRLEPAHPGTRAVIEVPLTSASPLHGRA